MRNLSSALWWKAALMRAVRTMLVIATPYVPTVFYDGNILVIVSAIGFAGVTSILTSLLGIAETTDGQVSWYWALAERVVKTAAQSLITLFGTATLFQDVDWVAAPQLIGTAVLGSILLAFMKGMPEAETPLASATVETVQLTESDVAKVVAAPVVASVPTSVAAESPTVTVAAESTTPVVAEGDAAVDRHDGRDG